MKKAKPILFLMLIILLGFGFGCTDSPTKATATTLTMTSLPVETISTVSTTTPTIPSGIVVATVNPTFLPTKKKTLEGRFKQLCAKVDSEVPATSNTTGTLVLYDRSQKKHYLQSLSSNHKSDLPDAQPYTVKISPSGKWIAYLRDAAPSQYNVSLIIQSTDGQVKRVLGPDVIGDVMGISGWLDDERLTLAVYSNKLLPTLLVVNPFTTNQVKLPPNFPNIYDDGTWRWSSSGLTVYSPNLRQVVYPAHADTSPPRYILWDIQSHREITAILSGHLIAEPQWAGNGQLVVVAVNSYFPFSFSEFYGASTAGMVLKLSAFEKWFQNIDTKIRSWSWSPDSQHIAFWLDIYQGNSILDEKLMVLDTRTGDVEDYCLPGDQIQIATSKFPTLPAPIWSPDGKSLLIENRYAQDQSRLLLFETDRDVAYELAQNMSPLGWFTGKP